MNMIRIKINAKRANIYMGFKLDFSCEETKTNTIQEPEISDCIQNNSFKQNNLISLLYKSPQGVSVPTFYA